jgi:alpha-tubulin suppressor-like RCC1 family protein
LNCKKKLTVLAIGSVWVCGNNESGVLGIDNEGANIFMPTKLVSLNRYTIARVDTGFKQSLFVSENDCLVCGEDDSFHNEPKPLKWSFNIREGSSKPTYMRDNYMKTIGNGTDHFIIHFGKSTFVILTNC